MREDRDSSGGRQARRHRRVAPAARLPDTCGDERGHRTTDSARSDARQRKPARGYGDQAPRHVPTWARLPAIVWSTDPDPADPGRHGSATCAARSAGRGGRCPRNYRWRRWRPPRARRRAARLPTDEHKSISVSRREPGDSASSGSRSFTLGHPAPRGEPADHAKAPSTPQAERARCPGVERR